MERNELLLAIVIIGCIATVTGFFLGQFLAALVIDGLVVIVLLYWDIQESHKPGRKFLRKNVAIAVFIAVTICSAITGWWIFWAGITAILYIDSLMDSTKEWMDARDRRSGVKNGSNTDQ